ncbi:AAA family ATPase [Planococcus donghaensis]|uniref:AAA family ATPase n=1 Tax=Planococcus donghaensis TaxID=414778 RepID=UPI003734C208
MYIKSIEIKNNPILGDLNLNLTDSNGLSFKTVLLAGENGTGKSTLLNIIHNFFDSPIAREESNESVTFKFEIDEQELEALYTSERFQGVLKGHEPANELTITKDHSKVNSGWYSLMPVISTKDGTLVEFEGYAFTQGNAKDIFKSVFSDVEVNYTSGEITSTSILDVDVPTQFTVKSSSNLATEITQLIIDIESLDNGEYARWARQNPGKLASEGITDKRMSRFKKAFNYMFPAKRFKEVVNRPEGKKVMFEENGKEISLNNLSSGEKQIVFRGSFLLKDKFATKGAVVLLDEPEISLHPKWQLKILDFYKTLFFDEKEIQTSQLIVATHSPFVIHNENQEKDKIVVLGKNESGIYVENEPTFYGWNSEEAVTEAFDIKLNSERDKLIVLVEGPTDEKYINKALQLFGKSDLSLVIKWVGRESAAGHKFTGEPALNHSKEYILSNNNITSNKFLLLYDSDTKAKDEDFEETNLFIRKLPVNKENQKFQIGVENLITLPPNFPKDRFYSTRENIDKYGAVTTSSQLEKIALCDWICDELEEDNQKIYLSKMETMVINIIEDINNK